MHNLPSLVFAAVLAVLIGYILVKCWGLAQDYFFNKVKWKTPITRKEYLKYHTTLTKHIDFYKSLSTAGKAKFINKTVKFLESKRFFAREGLTLTKEMAILISGAAAQLSYGMEGYYFSHIDLIHIYPKDFYFRLLNARLKGGTSEGGTMYFSWLDLEKGYAIEDDKYNLALHELAHALKINSKHDTNFGEHFRPYLNRWEGVGKNEFDSIRKGKNSFLRKYAGTNKQEFFAVCVEHFFEASKAFSRELPEIYNHLCVLLNQNPIKKDRDYRLNSNRRKRLGYKAKKWVTSKVMVDNISESDWHWSLSVFIFGACISSWLIPVMVPQHIISIEEIWILAALLVVLGGITQYRTIVKSKFMNLSVYSAYLILGYVPTTIALIFCLNILVPVSESEEIVKIESVYGYKNDYRFHLKKEQFHKTPNVLQIPKSDFRYTKVQAQEATHLKIVYEQGIFLIPIGGRLEPIIIP